MKLHPAYDIHSLLYDKSTTSHDLCNAFIDFCIYFNKLTKKSVRTAIQDRQLIDVVLSKNDLSDRNTFQKHLFAANATFQRLFKHVFPANIYLHSHMIKILLYDIYALIYIAEDFENKGILFQWGSRYEQSGREIYDASRVVFYLQSVETKTAYLREITPASIFLIRQALEVIGKNSLGIHSITSKNKQRYKNTQVAWEYISLDQKSRTPKIILPIDIHIVNKIITWTNGYILTGNLKEYYIIENVLEILLKLFYAPITSRVKNYENSLITFGIIRVSEYNKLKTEFEKYVNKRHISCFEKILIKIKWREAKENQWTVNWFPSDYISESTITSL